MNGKLISYEGIDRCGKTTQLRLSGQYLVGRGISVHEEREPGGTAVGGVMRMELKYPDVVHKMFNVLFKLYADCRENPPSANGILATPLREVFDHPQFADACKDFSPLPEGQKRTKLAEAFMYLASRSDCNQHEVAPRLDEGVTVLIDRLGDSTDAYQGGGLYRHEPEKIDFIRRCNDQALQKRWPDKTFFFDIPYEVMVERRPSGTVDDYIERRPKEFFDRTSERYRMIAREEPHRVFVVDGTLPKDEIFHMHVLPVLEKLFEGQGY